ncbi:MAG: O-antigen ligase family protein [Lachnospiraceae bacterium]|nr:O-antigen ligase family protein [Lachnospiraceae bacterium]
MSNKLAGNKKDNKKAKMKENAGLVIARNVLEYTVMALGIALCVLVPLYLKNGYHGVGDCKYELYKWIIITGTIAVAFMSIIYFCQGGFVTVKDTNIPKTQNRNNAKNEFEIQTDKPDSNKLQPTDLFVFAFLFFALLSALVGGNFSACIVGYDGWYMGILSLFSFALLYFMFAKAGRYYKAVVCALLATSFITYIIGILHRMMIDVIGTYYLGTTEEIADNFKNQFLSTLGQASWYSSFVCTVFPLGLAVFWYAKKKSMRIALGVFSFVGSMTLVTQNSDSAYMAMLGFFFVLFWFSATDVNRMERFMEVLVLFFAATRAMWLLLLIHPNERLDLDALSHFMVFSPWMWVMLLGVMAIWGLVLWSQKKENYPVKVMKSVRTGLLVVIILAVFCAVILLIMSAKGILPAGLLAVTEKIPYMTWSDNWGNGRGRTWAFSIQMYRDMDLGHKIFGVGPDGYAPYAYNLYADRLVEMWGERKLTNAHNEWINALINYGLAGCIAYIGIFVSACIQFAKNWEQQPILAGITACVVSYMCHNVFCYQTVCCTPFIFLLMGIGIYISTNSHLKKEV